ncbi:MAG: aldo/keto reductase [Phycisphaerales bacterium]|nr:MAG: aldo/keto reductase [Phycisphaerales bacterium]
MRRREFLARSIGGVGGLLLGSQFAARAERKTTTFDPYELVLLGGTGIKVSRVGFGTGMRGGRRQSNQTRLGKEKFEKLLRYSYERGVRFFDMADLYGSHPYVAGALKQMRRQDYVLASKIWWRRGGIPERERPEADLVVERFLKELETDYIDLILLHCISSARWPEELGEQMNILAKLKRKGLVRAHGVSCHSLESLKVAADEPWVDSVHARINAYGTKMDGPPEVVAPVLEKMHKAGKGVVGMKLIGEGEFRNSDEKRDESVRYVLGLGCVDMMIVGFEKTEQVDDFAARVRKVPVASGPSYAGACHPAKVA